jgi:4-amino-4-deoxy-L-arabinose transferase-like glycosyltransferase
LSLNSKSFGPERILHSLLALFIIYNFLILIPIFISHLFYRFPLEWVEGGVVDECIHILQGREIYAEPTAEFMAFVYTPLYFYLGALLMKLFGEGFFALRLISILSTLGTAFLIYRIVFRETQNRLAGWAACGLFAASFGVVGYWYDVGRVDSLAIFLILLSGYTLRYRPGLSGAVLSGVLFTLSFLTKQSALIFLIFLFVALCRNRKKDALTFALTSVVLCLTSLLFLGARSQGWSWFYLFKIPAATPRLYRSLLTYPINDLLKTYPFLLALALFAFLGGSQVRGESLARSLSRNFWFWFFCAGFLVSFLSRLKHGGWDNVLYSMVLTLVLLFGILLGQFCSSNGSQVIRRVIPLLLTLQFLLLLYDPLPLIPTKGDCRGGEILLERLREIDGPVLVFYHSHLGYLATGEMSAHGGNLKELPNLYDAGVPFAGMPGDMYQLIADEKYSAVVLDDRAENEIGNPWTEFVSRHYSYSEPIYRPGEPRLRFMTGLQTVPRFVYRPREDSAVSGAQKVRPSVR